MAGRRSVWSDARVRELAREFVPVADEVWRLQRGNDAECLFFQRSVNRGKPITDGGSRQGIWVIAPDGKLLARINSNSAERVLETLREGLAAWRAIPPDERRLPADAKLKPEHRWEFDFPEDGLVLARIARDLEGETKSSDERWNRDFTWFSRAEARGFLPDEPVAGASHAVPAKLVLRLARFALVDNVRGQTIPYARQEVDAELVATVVRRDRDRVALRLSGSSVAFAKGPWLLGDNLWLPTREWPHGIRVALVGEAEFDLAAGRFVGFELVGLGTRLGRTQFNGRSKGPETSTVGFHLALERSPRRIAPTFLALYGAAWVRLPKSPELELRPAGTR